MWHCPGCGFTLDPADPSCPRCQSPTPPIAESLSDWSVIARFGNAAEAGYFAHELAALLEIDPRITERDVLDEFSHAWRTTYLLAVPGPMAEKATNALRTIIQATSDDGGQPLEFSERRDRTCPTIDTDRELFASSRINWVPIVLTLTAGTFVFWATRKPAAGPVGKGPGDELWKALISHPEPWTQQGANGRVIRQLFVDPVRDRIQIREDLDGDGLFESISTVAHE